MCDFRQMITLLKSDAAEQTNDPPNRIKIVRISGRADSGDLVLSKRIDGEPVVALAELLAKGKNMTKPSWRLLSAAQPADRLYQLAS